MSGSDATFEEIVAAYLEAAGRGEAPARAELLARHPEHAERLGRFLDNEQWLRDAQAGSAGVSPPTVGQNEPQGDAPSRLRYVGDYEILGEIARGGMGVVYRARQISLGREVALKMILAGEFAGDDQLRRFRAEAEAAANLDHPNLVPVYEVGVHEGQPYFSMKLVAGRSLAEALPDLQGKPREVAALLARVARAVHHAHQRGVLHRDLKPGNVLLDEAGTPYVADFGLGRRLEDADRSASGIVGTPAYLAPEQARAQKGLTVAADTWSLGALLYECLAGREPFVGANVLEVLAAVVNEEPAPLPPSAGDLGVIARKCLNKDPARRYESAAALADDLERWLAGEPILARPAGRAERLWSWCRRNPTVAALLGTIAATLAAGVTVAAFFAERAHRRGEEALSSAEQARIAQQVAQREAADALRQKDEAERQKTLAQHRLFNGTLYRVETVYQSDPAKALALLDNPADCPPELRDFTWGLYRHWSRRQRTSLGRKAHKAFSVAFSPDGKTVAGTVEYQGKGGSRGGVTLWDARSGRELATLPVPLDCVRAAAFSPDSKTLAIPGEGKTVALWDVQAGKQLSTLEGHSGKVHCTNFSPDGLTLASGSADKTIKLWDVKTGRAHATLEHEWAVEIVVFSPDGKTLASVSGMDVRLWDVATGRERPAPKTALVQAVAFSPDSKTLASGEYDGIVAFWDVGTGRRLGELPNQVYHLTSVAYSPDGRTLASANDHGAVKLWDLRTEQERARFVGHHVLGLAFSPDGKTLASADLGGAIRLWDVHPRNERATLDCEEATARWTAFAADGNTLVSVSGGPAGLEYEPFRIRAWDVWTGQKRFTFEGATDKIRSLTLSPDGSTLLGFDGGEIKSWDVRTGQKLATLEVTRRGVTSVAFSPDGRTLAGAGTDRTIWLRDVATGKEIVTLVGHNQNVHQLAFSPDGKLLASAAGEWRKFGEIKLWDVRTGQEQAVQGTRTAGRPTVSFSPNGKTLACVDDSVIDRGVDRPDGAAAVVRLWDVETGEQRAAIETGRRSVSWVTFSPDGTLLALAGSEKTIGLWDARAGRQYATLTGHQGTVRDVAFSPDGKTLASAANDNTVRLWDAVTGQERALIRAHSNEVYTVEFSPNGKTLASTSRDGTIKLWGAPQDGE